MEHKTNHSLQATGTTRMFEAAVPDKLFKTVQDTIVLQHFTYMRDYLLSSKKLFHPSLLVGKVKRLRRL